MIFFKNYCQKYCDFEVYIWLFFLQKFIEFRSQEDIELKSSENFDNSVKRNYRKRYVLVFSGFFFIFLNSGFNFRIVFIFDVVVVFFYFDFFRMLRIFGGSSGSGQDSRYEEYFTFLYSIRGYLEIFILVVFLGSNYRLNNGFFEDLNKCFSFMSSGDYYRYIVNFILFIVFRTFQYLFGNLF